MRDVPYDSSSEQCDNQPLAEPEIQRRIYHYDVEGRLVGFSIVQSGLPIEVPADSLCDAPTFLYVPGSIPTQSQPNQQTTVFTSDFDLAHLPMHYEIYHWSDLERDVGIYLFDNRAGHTDDSLCRRFLPEGDGPPCE